MNMYVYNVNMCLYINVCWVACFSDTDPLTRSIPDPNTCSLWSRYTDDSKTDLWDDPEIPTGSCSGDQTAIRIQNRIMSCECLFLCIFLFTVVNSYLFLTCIISCDRLIYFTSMITCFPS